MPKIYCDFGGVISGESTEAEHDGWSELLSIDWSVDRDVTMGSATGSLTRGAAHLSPISMQKYMDTADPDLFKHCVDGSHIGEMLIHVQQETESKENILEITLSDAVIASTSWSVSGLGGEDRPMVMVSVGYGKIKTKYKEIKHDGSVGAEVEKEYDIETGVSA